MTDDINPEKVREISFNLGPESQSLQEEDSPVIAINWHKLRRQIYSPWGMLLAVGLISLISGAVIFVTQGAYPLAFGVAFDWVLYGFLISRFYSGDYRRTRPIKWTVASLLLSSVIFFIAYIALMLNGLGGGSGLWIAPGPGVGIASAANEYVGNRDWNERKSKENEAALAHYHEFLERYRDAAPIVEDLLDANCNGQKTKACPTGKYLALYGSWHFSDFGNYLRIPIPWPNSKYQGQRTDGGIVKGVSDAKACTTVCQGTVYDVRVDHEN